MYSQTEVTKKKNTCVKESAFNFIIYFYFICSKSIREFLLRSVTRKANMLHGLWLRFPIDL